MKTHLLLTTLLTLLLQTTLEAQVIVPTQQLTNGKLAQVCGACADNVGFENDVVGFTGTGGTLGTPTYNINMFTNAPIGDPAQHTIVTAGVDNGFPMVCDLIPGNTKSLRLGNSIANSGIQSVSYKFKVDTTIAAFYRYYYALVIQDGGLNHFGIEHPQFTVNITDASGAVINCTNLTINGSATTVAQAGLLPTANPNEYYCAWRPAVIPLHYYHNQCVTVTFTTKDCNYGDHYCYAYIDADCNNPKLIIPQQVVCDNGKTKSKLFAPKDQGSYSWTGPNIVGPSNRDSVQVLGIGRYCCIMKTKVYGNGTPCTFMLCDTVKKALINPVATFSYNNLCHGLSTNLTNNSAPNAIWTTYAWDINNDGIIDAISKDTANVFLTNVTALPQQIPVKLTVSNPFCTADTIQYVTVNPKPEANLGADVKLCQGDSIKFISSINTHYAWYDSASAFVTVIDTNQTYSITPIIDTTVTLIITNQYGCKDTDNVRINVNPTPVANFTAGDVCYPNITNFVNTSTNTTPADVYNWQFDLSLINNSALQNPSYNYTVCGVYPVKLIVTSPNNCYSAALHNVNVFCKPKGLITTLNQCRYDTVRFGGNNIGTTTLLNYMWDFEYTTANIQPFSPIFSSSGEINPNNLYGTDGTKNVVLVVTNTDGCKDTSITQVTVYPVPAASFTVVNSCKKLPHVFTSTSVINAPDNIATYQWDYNNDGIYEQTSVVSNQNYVYPFVLKADAYLVTTSNHNCKDTTFMPVEVFNLPKSKFETNNVCDLNAMNFTNLSTIVEGTIVNSKWEYTATDNVVVAAAGSTSFTFPSANYYTVNLITTSNHDCKDTVTKPVTVYPNPATNFDVINTTGCAPLCPNQLNLTTIDGSVVPTIITGYVWVFGTGDTSFAKTPNYCYVGNKFDSVKQYSPSLQAISNFGCAITLIKQNLITVLPQPNASFLATPTTLPYSTNIIEIFDKSSYSVLTTWDYGVPYMAIKDTSPVYQTVTYNDSGVYIIAQYVTNALGCKDTAYQTINVIKDFNLFIPNAFTPNSDGNNDYFVPKHFGITKIDLMIFNRWGDLIARVDESNKQGWDGLDERTHEKCKTDVYVWKMRYTTNKGAEIQANGQVTLLK